MRLFTLALVLSIVTACGPPPAPVVDMTGVDPATYNRHLAMCYRLAREQITFGNPVTKCMADNGYRILVGF